MTDTPLVAAQFAQRLRELAWVRDLWVAGSLATGDYVPGISDLDLVAVVDGPVGLRRRDTLVAVHRRLDQVASGARNVGCVYVEEAYLSDPQVCHPTWSHGRLIDRVLSGVTRAELVRHGYAVFGRPPLHLLPSMSRAAVQEAARVEVLGYWRWATRRPWMWLDPAVADLGLTSMARGRHSLATGQLLDKSQAIEQVDVPEWLRTQLRARRHGVDARSPRLRTAALAWRDARRTVAIARRGVGAQQRRPRWPRCCR